MIIELAPSFGGFKSDDWAPYHRAIENLITAHGEGWHLLSPSREVAKSILSSCSLSRTQAQIFEHHIANRVSVTSGQARSADLVILANPETEPRRTERANQLGVSLSTFSELAACAPARLITENAATDGKVIEALSELMSRDLGYNSPISFEHVHGGGGTTAACYEQACTSARPTLCVLDSDRKYPGAALGETARRVVQANAPHETIRTFILPVREVENSLPLSLLLDVYSQSPEVRGRVSPLLKYIERRVLDGIPLEANALDYIDFKFGLKRSDIAKLPTGQRAMFCKLAHVVRPTEISHDLYDDATDGTVIAEGISENLLAQFLSFIDAAKHKRREIAQKIKSSPAWPWLEDLLRLVLAFGTASARLPVR